MDQKLVKLLTQHLADVHNLRLEQLHERAAALGQTFDEYLESLLEGLSTEHRTTRWRLRTYAVSAAFEASLARLGLIPEPSPWPGFSRDRAEWVTREDGVEVRLYRVSDLWLAELREGAQTASGRGLTPRGALEAVWVAVDEESPEQAALFAILAREYEYPE